MGLYPHSSRNQQVLSLENHIWEGLTSAAKAKIIAAVIDFSRVYQFTKRIVGERCSSAHSRILDAPPSTQLDPGTKLQMEYLMKTGIISVC